MGVTSGLVAMAIAVLMVVIGKPRGGEPRAFVRPWMPLVSYSMIVMLLFIGGIAAVLTSL